MREQLEASLKQINTNYNILFAQPIEMRFNEMLEGSKSELSVKIYGSDFDVLEKLAGRSKDIINAVPGGGELIAAAVKGV